MFDLQRLENAMQKRTAVKSLQTIPGVGPRVAEDLVEMGIMSVADLRGKDPDNLYIELCQRQGIRVDRCMLYVFRCAVYYASTEREKHDPALLKWWAWKERAGA